MTIILGRRTLLKAMGGMAGAAVLGSACNESRQTSADGRPIVRVKSWTSLGYPGPYTYTGNPGYWRMSLLYDTLLWPDSTGKQLPWLAKSHEASEDGLVHTLELRDAKFDDGRPVRAQDVKFTYDYYTGGDKAWTPLLIGVPRPGIDVRVLGERKVEFRLDRPDPLFVQHVLGSMPITPEHTFAGITDPMGTQENKVLNGSGAYRLTNRSLTQDYEAYDAKDDYYLGTPFVKRIEMVTTTDDNDLNALLIGALDAGNSQTEGVRNEALDPFREDPVKYGMVERAAGFGFPLFFNLAKGGALADLRFRRACLHAIDRKDLVDRLLTGNGVIGNPGWLPPSNAFYEPDVPQYPFDPVEAERLLDEAGYRRKGGGLRTNPDGSPLRYNLHIAEQMNVALAELVGNGLQKVGLDIGLKRIDLIGTVGLKIASTYDLLVTPYPGPAPVGPEMDPDLMRAVYHSKPSNAGTLVNAGGYENLEVNRLLDEQSATYDVEKRKRLVSQVQKLVANDLPVAMLYYAKWFFVYRRDVFDQWYYTPGGFALGSPDGYNKHAYIVGRKVGLDIRKPGEPA
jgi:peptide/nickel transport system substrate-binding protein